MSGKKRFLVFLFLIVAGFVVFCGVLVAKSGIFESGPEKGKSLILLSNTMINGREEETSGFRIEYVKPDEKVAEPNEADWNSGLIAIGSTPQTIILGAKDPCTEDPDSGFKYQLELTSRGAAIRRVTFSNGEGKGFDNRDHDNPQPLALLEPIRFSNGTELSTMASLDFVFVDQKQKLALQNLFWKSLGLKSNDDGSQSASFEAKIASGGVTAMKVIKTYKLEPESYLVDCKITIENLTDNDQKVRFNLGGPVGIGKEGLRGDMRNVVGGFLADDGKIISSRRDLVMGFPMSIFTRGVDLKSTTEQYQQALRSGEPEQIKEVRKKLRIGYNLANRYKNQPLLWAATSNKYFTAIVRPVPENGADYCKWIKDATCQLYNPDGDTKAKSGDETIGIRLNSSIETLKTGGSNSYELQLYFGPKDKRLFDKDELYKKLGFNNVLTLMPCCCCPSAVIRPLAFGILALMEWLYWFIPNYGVVIIILVFVVRLLLHPLTKKGQVSMSRMTKLAPKVEQLKKKYAGDKAELNKQIMALYRQQGASPFSGMLPMLVQMPIWIALYSSIYASVSLRGAAFLPFWITDLSAPDALFRFTAVNIPLFGKIESFNLLPILMGIAFFLQQKLMPQKSAAATNPQMAQQQKMMMVMMPVLFPLMLYKAPSGLNLYIMSSVFAGVVEQYFIRKHIREKEQAESKVLVSATSKTGGKVKKKKPKPFFRNM